MSPATGKGSAAGLSSAASVETTAPPPALPTGRRGADLPRDATLSAPSSSLAGREPISAPPQAQLHWPAGSRPTPRCNPVGPIILVAGREPISAPPQAQPCWPAGSRSTPRSNPVGPQSTPLPHWPAGSQSQSCKTRHARRRINHKVVADVPYQGAYIHSHTRRSMDLGRPPRPH